MAWFNTLKSLREKSGESMSETAEILKIAKSTYASYEYGKREPNIEMLTKISNHFGVSTDYLLGREPAPSPFADLNLSEDDEAEVIAKYMSLPPEIRACMLDVLVQLGEAAKKRQAKPEPDDADYITVTTTLGEIEDRMKAEEDANSKDGA